MKPEDVTDEMLDAYYKAVNAAEWARHDRGYSESTRRVITAALNATGAAVLSEAEREVVGEELRKVQGTNVSFREAAKACEDPRRTALLEAAERDSHLIRVYERLLARTAPQPQNPQAAEQAGEGEMLERGTRVQVCGRHGRLVGAGRTFRTGTIVYEVEFADGETKRFPEGVVLAPCREPEVTDADFLEDE